MQIHEARQEEVHTITVQGQLDTVSAPQFEARLLGAIEKGARRLLIDCGALEYANSAGLKAFLIAAKQLDTTGGRMVICGLTPNVRMIFDMIGFSQIMVLVPTREEALRQLGTPSASTP